MEKVTPGQMKTTLLDEDAGRSGQPASASDGKYTTTAIFFHWTIAALMICGATIGLTMTGIPHVTPEKLRFYVWHKSLGVTVFALAALRIAWRATHPAPPLPAQMGAWQRSAAQLVHLLLYLLMLAIPVAGYLDSCAAGAPIVYWGMVKLPRLISPDPTLKLVFRTVHLSLNYALLVFVAAHVAAAVKHQWLDRDHLLSRMLPFWK